MNHDSRRDFLAATGLGAAGLMLAAEPRTAIAQPPSGARQVVPGSPSPNYSRAVVYNNLVFVAGVLGVPTGSRELISREFEPQARQVLENIKASVEAAGSSMHKVLKCTCYLTEASDFAKFNEVYIQFFPKDPPARSTLIVKALVMSGAVVEVDCVAALS